MTEVTVTLLTVMGMELYEFVTLWIMMGIGIYLPYRLIHRGLRTNTQQVFTNPENGQEGVLGDFEGEDFIHLITSLGLDDINDEVCELIRIYDDEPSRGIEARIREKIIFHLNK